MISVNPKFLQNHRIQPYDSRPKGTSTVEIVYFTLVGIGLYFASDWILDRIESVRGARFENRSVIFFVIILVLALVSFQVISHFMQP